MLKQRVVTAFILVAIILAAILLLPAKWFLALTSLVVIQAAWEWSALAGISKLPLRLAFLVLVLLAMLLVLGLSSAQRELLLLAGCLWWIHAYYLIRRYPALGTYWKNPWFLACIGLLVLLPAWAALVQLSDSRFHIQLILLFIGMVAAADTGAFFAGRAFGRHKLAPQVSPNKTWEGLLGGILLSCTLALVVYLVGYRGSMPGTEGFGQLMLVLAAALSIAIFSVVGDLFESIAKRQAGVKDSGSVLPGHGGILDRIDSITAALPLYALALKLVLLP